MVYGSTSDTGLNVLYLHQYTATKTSQRQQRIVGMGGEVGRYLSAPAAAVTETPMHQ